MNRNLYRIKDNEHLMKDADNGGVVNTDHAGYLKYKKQREVLLSKLEKEKDLQNKVESIETDINNIKSMLTQILQKLD